MLLRTHGFTSRQEFNVEYETAKRNAVEAVGWHHDEAMKSLQDWEDLIAACKQLDEIDARLQEAHDTDPQTEFNRLLTAFDEFEGSQAKFVESYERALDAIKTGARVKRKAAEQALQRWDTLIQCFKRMQGSSVRSAMGISDSLPTPSAVSNSSWTATRLGDSIGRDSVVGGAGARVEPRGGPLEAHTPRKLHAQSQDYKSSPAAKPIVSHDGAARGYEEEKKPDLDRRALSKRKATSAGVAAAKLPISWEKFLRQIVETADRARRTSGSDLGRKIAALISKVRDRLRTEGDETPRTSAMLEEVRKALADGDYTRVADAALLLLQQLRPIDLSSLGAMLRANSRAAEQIYGRDVVLLCGKTGAGKSTCLHFAAGSKFVDDEVDGERHLQPVDVAEDLQRVTTSPSTHSETWALAAVEIPIKSAAGGDSSVLLCDTPGFEDTHGPERSIANGLGIAQAVGHAASVRIMILFSKMSVGDKFDGVAHTASDLANSMEVTPAVLESLEYGFTKYEPNEGRRLAARIQAKLRDLNRLERANHAFVELLEDMARKTEGGARVICPLEDDRGEFLRMLANLPKIRNPQEVFRVFASQDSLDRLDQQIRYCRASLERAIDRMDVVLATYRLSQLMTVSKMLDGLKQSKRQKVLAIDCDPQRSIALVRERITELHDMLHKALGKFTSPERMDVEDYVASARKAAMALRDLDGIRRVCLPDLDSSEDHVHTRLHRATLDLLELLPEDLKYTDEEVAVIGQSVTKLSKLREGMRGGLSQASAAQIDDAARQFVDAGLRWLAQHVETAELVVNGERDGPDFAAYFSAVRKIRQLGGWPQFAEDTENAITELSKKLVSMLEQAATNAKDGMDELAQAVALDSVEVDVSSSLQSVTAAYALINSLDRYEAEVSEFLGQKDIVLAYTERVAALAEPFTSCISELEGLDPSSRLHRCLRLLRVTNHLRDVSIVQHTMIRLHTNVTHFLGQLVDKAVTLLSDDLGRLDSQLSREGRAELSSRIQANFRVLATLEAEKECSETTYHSAFVTVCSKISELVKRHTAVVKAADYTDCAEGCASLKSLAVLAAVDKLLPSPCGARKAAQDYQRQLQDAIVAGGRDVQGALVVEGSSISFNSKVVRMQLDRVAIAHQSSESKSFTAAIVSGLELWRDTLIDFGSAVFALLEHQSAELKSAAGDIPSARGATEAFIGGIDTLRRTEEDLAKAHAAYPEDGTVQCTVQEVTSHFQALWLRVTAELLPSLHAALSDAAGTMRAAAESARASDVVDPNYPVRVSIALGLSHLDDRLPGDSAYSFAAVHAELTDARAKRREDQTVQLRLLESNCDFAEYAEMYSLILVRDPHQHDVLAKELERVTTNLLSRAAFTTRSADDVGFDESCSDELRQMVEAHDILQLAVAELKRVFDNSCFRRVNTAFESVLTLLRRRLDEESGELLTLLGKQDFLGTAGRIEHVSSLASSSKGTAVAKKCPAPFYRALDTHVDEGFCALREVLGEQVKHFKQLGWSDFSHESPRRLFSALFKLRSYQATASKVGTAALLKELSDGYVARAQELIAAARREDAGPEDEENLQLLHNARGHLPKSVCAMFIDEVEAAKNEFAERRRAEEAEAAQEEENGALKKLIISMHIAIEENNFTKMQSRAMRIERNIRQKGLLFTRKLRDGQLREISKGLVCSFTEWQYFIHMQAQQCVPREWRGGTYYEFVADPERCRYHCDSVLNALHSLLSQSFLALVNKLNGARDIRLVSNMRAHLQNLIEYVGLWNDYHGVDVEEQRYHIFYHVRGLKPRGAAGGAGAAAGEGSGVQSLSLADLVPRVFALLSDFLHSIESEFVRALNCLNVSAMAKMLTVTRGASTELTLISDIAISAAELREVRKAASALAALDLLSSMRQKLAEKLLSVQQQTCESCIVGDKRAWSSTAHNRDEFYQRLADSYRSLKDVRILSEHVDVRVADVAALSSKAEKHLQKELRKVSERGQFLIGTVPTHRVDDYEHINIALENLRAVSTHFDDSALSSTANSSVAELKRSMDLRIMEICDGVARERDLRSLVRSLMQVKAIGIHAPAFKTATDRALDALLLELERSRGPQLIADVSTALTKIDGEDGAVAQMLIAEQNRFKDVAISIRNEKTKKQGMGYVVKQIRYEDSKYGVTDKEKKRRNTQLAGLYTQFDAKYWQLVEEGILDPATQLVNLVRNAAAVAADRMPYTDQAVNLMAILFAHWTLSHKMESAATATAAEDADQESERERAGLLQPHAAQSTAIFRMLGLDVSTPRSVSSSLHNQLVEIGTGEGKSVTLAITAAVLALLGYSVDCACYSKYLSKRDHESFLPLFRAFGVAEKINFGTFNEMCEKFINRRGDVRELTVAMIEAGPVTDAAYLPSHATTDRNVLLVDEVDVFFDKSFYGSYYRPLAELRHPTITALIEYIWDVRKQRSSLQPARVKATKQYKNVVASFAGWESLIEEATKCMIADVQSFETMEYHLSASGQVGYKEQDGISYQVRYGYKTMFTYFHEHELARVTKQQRDRQIAIVIDCGIFSYAEIPKQYDVVMGVSGTLKELTTPEKELLSSVYQITEFTFMPSVYGSNQLKFRKDDPTDVQLEEEAKHHMALRNEINRRLVGEIASVSRAVLVFFPSSTELLAFYKSAPMRDLTGKVRIITPNVGDDDKEGIVRQAVTQGAITLLTREFGRGTDFKCYDSRLVMSGGVHVIQTFVSDQVSEETQIKGRSARQGDKGSFSMVLNKRALERFGLDEATMDASASRGKIKSTIDEYRDRWFMSAHSEGTRYVKDIRKDHKEAEAFAQAIARKKSSAAKKFLLKRNACRAKFADAPMSRTVVCLDATGSMSLLLAKAKNTINEMFTRAYDVIDEKAPGAVFDVQMVVYRNYNCNADSLLQSTAFESSPEALRTFLSTVSAAGGCGREALEIAFHHVNDVISAGTRVSQVVMLGDRGPNSKQEVERNRRANHGEQYWATTKYATQTHFQAEVVKLKAQSVPIHCFYVVKGGDAETDFQTISSQTGGESDFLDVNASDGAAQLTHVVTKRILGSVGGQELVKAYEDKYMKGFVAAGGAGGAVGGAGGAGGAAAPTAP